MTKLSYTVFHDQIGRLVAVFGKKMFLRERQDLIWEYVKVLEDDDFTGIVEDFLKSNRQAPLPRHFEEATKKIMDRRYHTTHRDGVITRSEHENKPKCAYCSDSGILEAQIIGENNAVHFHCDCPAMNEKSYALPVWGDHFGMQFKRLPMWPDRIKKWIPRQPGDFQALQDQWKARIQISEQFWKWRENDGKN